MLEFFCFDDKVHISIVGIVEMDLVETFLFEENFGESPAEPILVGANLLEVNPVKSKLVETSLAEDNFVERNLVGENLLVDYLDLFE